jgi:hypothetical protein
VPCDALCKLYAIFLADRFEGVRAQEERYEENAKQRKEIPSAGECEKGTEVSLRCCMANISS